MNAEGRVRGEVGLREGGGGMLVRNEGECVDREDGRWWMMSHVLGEGSIDSMRFLSGIEGTLAK